jgi:hypothetical protein
MTIALPKHWCYYCARSQLVRLHVNAEWSLYRCGICQSWIRCQSCAGTVSPSHDCAPNMTVPS